MHEYLRMHNQLYLIRWKTYTVYPKKYAHGFCFAVLCCGYTLTDFPIPTRLTSLALWQSNDCPSAGKVTLIDIDKYFMWIHYERLHNHNKAKHNKTVCIFLGIYCKDLDKSSWTFIWGAYFTILCCTKTYHDLTGYSTITLGLIFWISQTYAVASCISAHFCDVAYAL